MKTLLLLLVSLLAQVSFAQRVKDPQNLLNQIDQFITARDFEDEFIPGDLVKTLQRECFFENDGNGNSSISCDEFYEDLDIIETGSDWTQYSNGMAIVKELYERYNRNPIRYFLREKAKHLVSAASNNFDFVNDTDFKFTFSLQSLTSMTFLGENALRLDFDSVILTSEQEEYPIPMYIVIIQNAPFLGQVAQVGLEMIIDGQKIPASYEITDFQKN